MKELYSAAGESELNCNADIHMKLIESFGLALLGRLDPEVSHRLSLMALKAGIAPVSEVIMPPKLRVSLSGLNLPNPLGLGAGYDKNGEAIGPLLNAGFGFIEVGAVTPKPQLGNPRPRVFRLREDRAVINRLGFNNEGAAAMAERLRNRTDQEVVGINMGPNRDSPNREEDYARVLEACGEFADFATINVSSPNTPGLRNLQQSDALERAVNAVQEACSKLRDPPRIFLKVAPDITEGDIAEIAQTSRVCGVDAIIATNTTLTRSGLKSPSADQPGGLSGQPLFNRSTEVLRSFHRATGGRIPLIGVGGIFTGADAYAKIRAGATAVQIYTGLAYRGLSAVGSILRELDALLERDGFDSVSQAVGSEAC